MGLEDYTDKQWAEAIEKSSKPSDKVALAIGWMESRGESVNSHLLLAMLTGLKEPEIGTALQELIRDGKIEGPSHNFSMN